MAFVEMGLPTVLVAEGAADFRQLLVSQLTGEGFAVDTATSGRAAVEAARDLQPDVVAFVNTDHHLDHLTIHDPDHHRHAHDDDHVPNQDVDDGDQHDCYSHYRNWHINHD